MQPSTPATIELSSTGVAFRLVGYGRVSSAEEAAQKRGVALSQLAKTLVVRVGEGAYVLVAIPGDHGMDYRKLRTALSVRRLSMPDPEEALKATGYSRGAITPIGAGGWPVLIDKRLMEHTEVSLGSGVHGWAIHMSPADLVTVTDGRVVDVAS